MLDPVKPDAHSQTRKALASDTDCPEHLRRSNDCAKVRPVAESLRVSGANKAGRTAGTLHLRTPNHPI